MLLLDSGQWRLLTSPQGPVMKRPVQAPPNGGKETKTKPSRTEEARRVVEEYVKDLLEMIKRLRGRLH
ncbi:hypothetical protein [Bradyrhizobium sp. F1.13.3]|uniref:hypothetical protein n=1 Tax=Bradyrhizobium sp. F1.13.3 TaxID=3156351 RepID=UPI003396CD91